ncbi:DUF952 domain-containing protein [Aestuariivirga litoralis]|uniref:DUF952 domain-containing protein n=1 Tax=Aestuariivirga litoralis TaxID=2650924 RepID=UPI0018C8027D|nr:DUF952 domain-containing protein [Aestuariivirga litoralis]
MAKIFKIIDKAAYELASQKGRFEGAEIDLKDGYIHFSSGTQMQETARRHFAGRANLMLLAVDAEALGEALKWEASRGGQLFPHLYGVLEMRHVVWAKPLPWNGAEHDFPAEAFA